MNKFLSVFLLFTTISGTNSVSAADYEAWQLAESAPRDNEYLLYRAAYRGLFTAFIWKDLADVAIFSVPGRKQFDGQDACLLNMKLSTENFSVAELFQPVRFHWRSTVSPDLRYVYLVEAIDSGKKQRHEFAWLDVKNQHIEVYRKRKKIPARILTYDEEDEGEDVQMVWEPDNGKKPPAFLDNQPPIDDQRSYFIHDRTVAVSTADAVVDPLALVYSLRWQDLKANESYSFVVPYEDSFRRYNAVVLAEEAVQIGTFTRSAIKVEVRRSKKEDANNEGYLHVWYSDDDLRIPLQFHIDAKVGKIQLQLTEAAMSQHNGPEKCISRFPKSQTSIHSY